MDLTALDHLVTLSPPSSIETRTSINSHLYSSLQNQFTPIFTSTTATSTTTTNSHLCGHLFSSGEAVYRCRECATDATCVLCLPCYRASLHYSQHHDITMSIHDSTTGQGCCDCGDIEAFKSDKDGKCTLHSPSLNVTEQDQGDDDRTEIWQGKEIDTVEMTRAFEVAVEERIILYLDWMIDVLEASPEEMICPTSTADIIAALPTISQRSTTPPFSPPPPILSTSTSTNPPLYPSSTSRGKARATSPSSFSSSASSSTSHNPIITDDPVETPLWSVILWNDEQHSFVNVIDQVSRATGCSRQTAAEVAQNVDTYGRDVIFTSSDLDHLLRVAKSIASIDLVVTVRLAVSTFLEQVACQIIHFIKGMCAINVFGQSGKVTPIVAKVLLYRPGTSRMSRFQRLIRVDARLWKEARKGLAEIYVTLMAVNPQVKTNLSVDFAQMYSNLAEAYLLTDREPDNSVISFGIQVFTVPSVATLLVSQHSLLNNIIAILHSFFTEQPILSPRTNSTGRINPDSAAFKQKRYFHIFNDLHHLISSPRVKQLICSNDETLRRAFTESITFFDLFTAMDRHTRAAVYHVEYESDTWVSAFNVTIQLGRISRAFGEAFRFAGPGDLVRSAVEVLKRMSRAPRGVSKFHMVHFGGVFYELVQFKVEEDPVSFHHPLGWLFAEMMKNVIALDDVKLMEIGATSLSQVVLSEIGQEAFLQAMDQPLRVIALVAQIRAGLWVRNGFGMRAQQLHYKEYSLRENTYDQDVYFLQTALVILDPSLIFIAILDRFQLQSWLGGNDLHPAYDPTQAFAMVEEMIYTLIVLLSDSTHPIGLSDADCLRREIIHHLVLAPLPYSELVRRVSEKYSDDPELDKVLQRIATFKLPAGTNDQGIYTLKEEFYSEVDPYFSRYTRNQREEAETIVRDQMKRVAAAATGRKEQENVVIVPKRLNITSGPFVRLATAFTSDALLQIIFFSLQHGRSRGTLFSETLVDEALHLAMLALLEQPVFFLHFAYERTLSRRVGETNLIELVIKIEDDERMRSVRHKAQWILDRLIELTGGDERAEEIRLKRKVEDMITPAMAEDQKRAAAKRRQEAIMKQFALAQQSFLDSAENIDDEEDDEEGEGQRVDEENGMMMDEDGGKKKVVAKSYGSCIVCQDELDRSKPFGSLALIQTSNFIRNLTNDEDDTTYGVYDRIATTPTSFDRDTRLASTLSSPSTSTLTGSPPQYSDGGLHISACGHQLHLHCFETYYTSIETRHNLQPTRCHPEDVDRCEFVCPLCKSLGNVLLPVVIEDESEEEGMREESEEGEFEKSLKTGSLVNDQGGEGVRTLAEATAELALVYSSNGDSVVWPWPVTPLNYTRPSTVKIGMESMTLNVLGVASSLATEMGHDSTVVVALVTGLIGYTLSTMEIASRSHPDNLSAVEAMSTSSVEMMKSLVKILRVLPEIRGISRQSVKEYVVGSAQRLMGDYAVSLPRRFEDERLECELEALERLIEIAVVAPNAFQHIVTVGFYSRLWQVYHSVAQQPGLQKGLWGEEEVTKLIGEDDELLTVYAELAKIRSFDSTYDGGVSDLVLGKVLYVFALPYLRRVSMLQKIVFDASTSTSSSSSTPSSSLELCRLLIELDITPLSQAFAPLDYSPATTTLQFHLFTLLSSVPQRIDALIYQLPTIYELVTLPNELDSLAADSLVRVCQRCETVPREPALCLFCGHIVCSQSFCCMDGEAEAQHGECNTHMWTCGGPVGVYFLIKKNSILYLSTSKGSFSTPPYLDAHGEVDIGGRRGRSQFPQYLHRGRYDEIRKTWLNHGIPTFVARKLEVASDYGGWTSL